MAPSSALHNMLEIQPSISKVTSPQPTHQQSQREASDKVPDIDILPSLELEQMDPTKQHDDAKPAGAATPERPIPTGSQSPKTPNELESSRPPTPRNDEAVGQIRAWNAEPMTKWRILCCCVIYFSNGINDSGT